MVALNKVNFFEPQRVYKWFFSVEDFNFKTEILQTANVPFREISSDPFHIGGGEISVPSFFRSGTLTLELLETAPLVLGGTLNRLAGAVTNFVGGRFYNKGSNIVARELNRKAINFVGGEIRDKFLKSNGTQVSVGGDTIKLLQAWRDLVISEDGVFGYPESSEGVEGFKKTAYIKLLDGENNEHTSIKLYGMYPTLTAPLRLTYLEDDKVVINQDFSVDDVRVE